MISCDKTEETVVANSSSNNGVLSGKIVDFVPTAFDSIAFVVYDNNTETIKTLGKSKISSLGEFSWFMINPTISLEKIGSIEGVAVSDSNALTTSLHINTYKSGVETGNIQKCNYILEDDIIGASNSGFIYSDRAITIKGTEVDNGTNSSGFSYADSTTFNLSLKKGWNEFSSTVLTFTSTANSEKSSRIVSNNIGSDLQWRYFSYERFNVQKKVKSHQPVLRSLHNKLF